MLDTLAQKHLGKKNPLIFQDMIKLFNDTLLKEFQNIAISTQDISAKLEFFFSFYIKHNETKLYCSILTKSQVCHKLIKISITLKVLSDLNIIDIDKVIVIRPNDFSAEKGWRQVC